MKKKKEGHIDRIYRKGLSRLAVSPPPGLWSKIEREIPPPPRLRPAFSYKGWGLLALAFFGGWFILSPAEGPSLGAFPIPGNGRDSEAARHIALFDSGPLDKHSAPLKPMPEQEEARLSDKLEFCLPVRPAKESAGNTAFPSGEVEPRQEAGLPLIREPGLLPAQEAWEPLEQLMPAAAEISAVPALPPGYTTTSPAGAQYPGVSYEWHAEWLAPLYNSLGEQLGLEQPNWKGDRRMGLALDVRFSRHWGMRTGLGIREMNLRFERQALLEYAPGYPSATTEGLYVSDYKYRTAAGLETTTAIGFRQSQSSGPPLPGEQFEFSLEMAQQVCYYSLPLEAIYYLNAKGLQLNLRAGLALNGYLWEARQTTHADFSISGFVHQGTGLNLAVLPRHFLEMTAGAGVYYQHRSGLAARFEPGLRYTLTPMFNRPGLLAGLLIGIGYHF